MSPSLRALRSEVETNAGFPLDDEEWDIATARVLSAFLGTHATVVRNLTLASYEEVKARRGRMPARPKQVL